MSVIDSLPSDNPSESAKSVSDALKGNKASSQAVQGGDTPSSDGKPTVKRASVKRSQPRGSGGKFARKKPADTVEKPQNTDDPLPKPQADTVQGGDGDGFVRVPTDPQPLTEPSGVDMGPEAGQVITDGIFNIATKRGGKRWEPTTGERDMISKAANGAVSGRRVPWWLALTAGIGFYMAARIGVKQITEDKKDVVNKHSNHRPDAKRKDVVRSETGWAFEDAI